MTSRSRALRIAFALALFALSPSTAAAGAWLLPPGDWASDIRGTFFNADTYYNVDGEQLIRAWVCADPAPRDVSLEVVRGSHRWNVTYRPPVGMDPASQTAVTRGAA